MTISFIWFDLGYTLAYQDREAAYERFLLEEGIDLGIERIQLAYHLTDKLFMRDYPGVLGREVQTFYPWYIGLLNHTLGLSFDLDRQCRYLSASQGAPEQTWKVYPEALRVLRELKEQSYGVGLISNWDRSARAVLESTGLAGLLDPIVISSEVGAAKPDPEIFRIALEKAGVRPGECLYVGDNYYDDVVGSEKAGLRSCLINRYGTKGIEEIRGIRLLASLGDLNERVLPAIAGYPSYREKGRIVR